MPKNPVFPLKQIGRHLHVADKMNRMQQFPTPFSSPHASNLFSDFHFHFFTFTANLKSRLSHSSVKVAAGCFLLTVIACCWCSCWRDTFKPRETFPSRISTRFFLHTQTHIWRIHRSFNFITPSKNWVVDGTYQVTLQLSTCGENMKFDHWPLSLHLEKIGWQLLFTNIPGRCIL